MKPNTQNWEKELDEKFPVKRIEGSGRFIIDLSSLKSFISSLLSHQEQEAEIRYAKEVIPKLNAKWLKRFEQKEQEVKKEIKRIIEEDIWVEHKLTDDFKNKHNIGKELEIAINGLCLMSHNQALQDLKQFLTPKINL